MRILIAILSCVHHELNGYNQALRDTWLSDAARLGFDYRFLIGNGKATGEDETSIMETFNQTTEYKEKHTEDPDFFSMSRKLDHMILDVPDYYTHSCYKLRSACRWALDKRYDYVFQVLTDTFVVPSRLLESGFEQHDYVGAANGERTYVGGAAIWFSRRSLWLLASAPVTHWAADIWTGEILLKNDIQLTHDSRYVDYDTGPKNPRQPPKKDNNLIACHIANTPTIYDSRKMYELQKEFKETQ